jgi:hypothetical protein
MISVAKDQKLIKSSTVFERRLPVNLDERDSRFYKDELRYKTYDCYLDFVKNARISSDSIVYKNGVFLVAETLYSEESKTYYKSSYLLKKILLGKKNQLDRTKKYLLATDYSSSGHFHWLTEALPRIFCVKDLAPDFVLLLPDTPYIRKVAMESIDWLGISFQDVIFMKENEFYKAENLYFVSKLCRTGQMDDEIMQKINARFGSSGNCGTRRLYVSREKAAFRKILNEKELIAVLKANDFEILYGEDFSFAEQVEIFSTCRTLLGIHGAGLTNCLFMNPQTNLIELRRNEVNVGYWFLADCLNQNYYYYNGIPDSDKSVMGRGCNLTIPVNDFEEKILKNLQN